MRPDKLIMATGLLIFCGCMTRESESTMNAEQNVYVDLRTRDAVLIEPTDSVPAMHPQTGERTLMPGLYCSACREWHPAPPLEELQRNPAAQRCPRCRAVMSGDGPRPED